MTSPVRALLLASIALAALSVAGCEKQKQKSEAASAPPAPVAAAVVPYLAGQKTCPVSGLPIDPKAFVDYQGKRVYFCCTSCPKAFLKDPKPYLAKLDAQRGGTSAQPHGPTTGPASDMPGHAHGGA